MGKITVVEGGYGEPKQYLVKLLSDHLGSCVVVDALDGLVLNREDNDVTRGTGAFSHWCRVYSDKIAPVARDSDVIVVNGPMTLKYLCGGIVFPMLDNLLLRGSPDYWLPMKTILIQSRETLDKTNSLYQHGDLFDHTYVTLTGKADLIVSDTTKNLELKSKIAEMAR